MAKRLEALKEVRIDKLQKLKTLGINPYPSKVTLKGTLLKIAVVRDLLDKEVLCAGRNWQGD